MEAQEVGLEMIGGVRAEVALCDAGVALSREEGPDGVAVFVGETHRTRGVAAVPAEVILAAGLEDEHRGAVLPGGDRRAEGCIAASDDGDERCAHRARGRGCRAGDPTRRGRGWHR